MLSKYCQLLEVNESSTLEEIKKAYRRKAKVLHPDTNPSAHAHKEFILLTEAYEYLVNYKNGTLKSYKQPVPKPSPADIEKQQREKWREQQRKKRWEQEKKEEKENTRIIKKFSVALVVLVLVWVSFYTYTLYGLKELVIGLTGIVITSPFIFRFLGGIYAKGGTAGIPVIGERPVIRMVAITLLNVFLVLKIGLNTLIPVFALLQLFAMLIIASLALMRLFAFFKNKNQAGFVSFGIAPLVLNIVLTLNYLFASNPVTERYLFVHQMQNSNGKMQPTTAITLKDNKYDAYEGIRVFADFEQMRSANTITYTFEEGLFGLRVMTDYQFEE